MKTVRKGERKKESDELIDRDKTIAEIGGESKKREKEKTRGEVILYLV